MDVVEWKGGSFNAHAGRSRTVDPLDQTSPGCSTTFYFEHFSNLAFSSNAMFGRKQNLEMLLCWRKTIVKSGIESANKEGVGAELLSCEQHKLTA